MALCERIIWARIAAWVHVATVYAGVVTMKNRSLFSVVSLLALTLGAPSMFAADREVPPSEPAPARQEAAPPPERAAPAPARRAARPAQPTKTASTSSAPSWTGNQAGGFGGGNSSAGASRIR
jgi:hypothetical protein